MRFISTPLLLALLPLSGFLAAQAPLVNPEAPRATPAAQAAAMAARLDYRPGVTVLSQVARTLRNSPDVTAESKQEADKLVAEAGASQRAGANGEARRSFSHAIAILRGMPWDQKEEFSDSLVLRPNDVVADSALPFIVELTQSFPVRYPASSGIRMHLALAEATPSTALDVVKPTGKIVAEIGTFDMPARDLIENPHRVSGDVSAVPAGMYMVVAELSDSDKQLGRIVTPVHLVKDMYAKQQQLLKQVAAIKGHESTKASILYRFDLAKGINTGQREVLAYNFSDGIGESFRLVEQLKSGVDPLYRAKGDHHRNYVFTDAHEIMPYRVYVPTTWNGKAKLPLIVALHGSNLDENNFLERAHGVMEKLAEQKGYIVATPLGYRINGAYGNVSMGGGPGASAGPPDPARVRMVELSEKDVLNVMEQVAEEYNVDRSRIYLMGNSMGGGGTYHIGTTYAERFAALVPCASGLGSPANPEAPDFPFDRLKGMPLITVAGELDGVRTSVVSAVKQMKEHGLDPVFVDVKGGTHGTAVEIAMPQIFDFFDQHKRSDAGVTSSR